MNSGPTAPNVKHSGLDALVNCGASYQLIVPLVTSCSTWSSPNASRRMSCLRSSLNHTSSVG